MIATATIYDIMLVLFPTFCLCFAAYFILKKSFFFKKEDKKKDNKDGDFKGIQDMKIIKNNVDVDSEPNKDKLEIIDQDKNKPENQIKELKERMSEMEKKMNKIGMENYELKDKMKITDLNLMIQKSEINILQIKNNTFLNSFKILYFRKIANILLYDIFNNYWNQFYQTKPIFRNEQKPEYKAKPFPVIIAKEPINGLKINDINLLIDYLMFIKDFTSSFIHIEKKYPIQIEILFSLFEEKNIIKDENTNEYSIDSSILINTILGEKEKEKIEEQKNDEISISEEINEISTKEKAENIINIPIKIAANNEANNGNGNSSDNGISTNVENNEKEKQSDDIFEKNEKDELMKKIDEIIVRLSENYQNKNYSMEEELNQINELNVENLLKKKQGFSKNELLKLGNIKSLKDLISKHKDSKNGSNIIGIGFIFNEWKNSFNQSYKKSNKFKSLVVYDQKIELIDIKNVANGLIIKNEAKTLKIFGTDPGNFQGFTILDESDFQWYSEMSTKYGQSSGTSI